MIGTQVSHYRITGMIGAGGMGIVYQAEDTRLNRPVAMKFLSADFAGDALSRTRFLREAQTASALNHPNICAIYDIGEHGDEPYIVMELLRGKTLREKINSKPLPLPTLLRLGTEVAEALDAAHKAGIVHRDIKVTNIFVDERGHARLLDFGLAKLVEETPGAGSGSTDQLEATQDFVEPLHTSTGTVVGTTAYMSPEQARGEALDARSDIFSFGVVMYEMATGRRPFGGKTLAVTFDQILNKVPASISSINPSLPAQLVEIVVKTLAKRPENRYQTAEALFTDLREVQRGGQTAVLIDASTQSTPAVDAASQRQPTVAVLPFVNMTGNSENEYFGDGLAEELISNLATLQGVRVVSRTSAFQFKGQSLDVREVGQRLNANTVLEGSFRMAGKRIRILANFINVEDGFQLWSERFDRDMEDVFAVQDEITQTIVHALELTLVGKQKKVETVQRPTENVEAYNLYLKGRFHWKKRTPDAIHKAIDYFKSALQIDPDYAVAHAGLADCYAMFALYAVMPRRVVIPQALASAERALELDDTLAEAHAAIGLVRAIHDYQWEEAERRFSRAIELAPDHAVARIWFSWFVLLPQRRFDEAMGQAVLAAELDPVNPSVLVAAGMVHYMHGSYEDAIESIETALTFEPTYPLSNFVLAYACNALGDSERALAALKHCRTMRVAAAGATAWAHVVAENLEEADNVLCDLLQMSKQGNLQADFEIARVQMLLGNLDAAFERLDRTYEERSGALYWIDVNPAFEPLRSDPRYDTLLERVNLKRN